MSSYKLSYFNGRGRAEVARYMFAMTDTKYVDHRIEGNWQEYKPKTPFGALPVLEVDGVQICQSSAIERLLARRFNLYGKDDMEQARCDMVVGCCEDLLQAMFKTTQGSDDEEKAKKKKEFMEEKGHAMLANFEKMVGPGPFFLGDKMMWCDIELAHLLTYFEIKMIGMADFDMSKYPKVCAIKAAVESQPAIAAWIKQRPESTF